MYLILDKAWRIYYKNIIVHIFFSILFLALPYAMYLLSKAQVGYVASAIVILLLSAAEVFFGFFPFYVSVAKERISILRKRLLRPATLLALWWAPLVTALYIVMQLCLREEVLPTVAAFLVFGLFITVFFFLALFITVHNLSCEIGKGNVNIFKGCILAIKCFFASALFISFLPPALIALVLRRNAEVHSETLDKPTVMIVLALLFSFPGLTIYVAYSEGNI